MEKLSRTNVKRRDFLKMSAIAGLGLASFSCSSIAYDDRKGGGSLINNENLNILLITADDMNYDTPGVMGCSVADITPNIDKLASEGLLFKQAHVTSAVCQPSRSVLMTGRYPHRNGATGFNAINEDVSTLQEYLREANYFQGILAKETHLMPQWKFCWDVVIPGQKLGRGRDPKKFHEHCTSFFQQAKDAGKPFFLMANSQDPHRPFSGSDGEKHREEKTKVKFPTPSRVIEPEEAEIPGFLPDIPGVREEMAQYYTSCHRCDNAVGAILKALDESGLAEKTVVMFLSDNGISQPFAKTNCYLNSTKTPWIVRWPGVTTPGQIDDSQMISGIDFMPTILDMAGLPADPDLDGRSFKSILEGQTQEDRDWVYTMFWQTSARKDYPMRAYQTTRYGYLYNAWSDGETEFVNEPVGGLAFRSMKKAADTDKDIADRVHYFQYRTPEEFYDFKKDPNALNNLIDAPEYQEVIREMKTSMLKVMQECGDPLIEQFKEI